MIAAPRLPSLDQIATAVQSLVTDGPAAGCRAVDVRVWGGIDIRVLPDRGFDIGAAWFRGVPLAWISDVGERPPLEDRLLGDRWRERFGGGLVVTCGLSNVGAPSEGHGLHGTYSHRRATDVHVERSAEEVALRARIPDPPFEVERRIATRLATGLLRIDDRVRNAGAEAAPAPMLYHVNVGAPLWDEGGYLETDADEIVPRDAAAAAGLATWGIPPTPADGAPERVFEHVGATEARLTSAAAGLTLTVRSSFPRLWQWVHPATGVYALGIEPANCSVLGRAADRAAGRLPELEPDEVRESWLTIEARSHA